MEVGYILTVDILCFDGSVLRSSLNHYYFKCCIYVVCISTCALVDEYIAIYLLFGWRYDDLSRFSTTFKVKSSIQFLDSQGGQETGHNIGAIATKNH